MRNERRLGQGLSGLISGTAAQEKLEDYLSTSLLHAGKFQPRKHFDAESLQELADSIKKNGIVQPIIVRKDLEDGGYEIVAGERRFRASKIAGLSRIPVIIRDLSDKECLEISIIENVQRENINPIEEAEAYRRLIDEFSYTHEELGSIVGKSRSHITNMTRMLLLSNVIKEMVSKKKLSAGHARALINVKNAEEVAKKIISQELSVRQTESLIQKLQNLDQDNKISNELEQKNNIKEIENTISSKLGLTVKINDNNSKGKITLQYNNINELDLILKKLSD
ncbi:ParB/RepB/Spo0J family partition protein [Wolbachia endosymbiont of Pentidionis agamae]|uniref:ParB/RepB/Spo0J family partition protein n=1 Tax=Wolbachia endosymbiont of Pentidionis agamae TaxID=3110435 RepID=UPI002FD34F9C